MTKPTSRSPKSRQPSRRAAKTGRPVKSRRISRAPNLPTARQFEALTLKERTQVFAAWLKGKRRSASYVWMDPCHCPLGRFGRAIFGKGVAGGVSQFFVDQEAVEPSKAYPVFESVHCENALLNHSTFGDASDAFQAALKTG